MDSDQEIKPALPLEELELAPQWVKAPAKTFSDHTGQDREERRRGPRPSGDRHTGDRDRRPPKPQSAGPNTFRDRPPRTGPSKPGGLPRRPDQRRPGPPSQHPPQHRPPPPPALAPIDIAFFPEEKGFASMLDAMRQSPRAFALFDVAKLVLNKPERHVVRLTRKPAADGSRAPLYLVSEDETPFLTQDEAIRFVFRRHPDRLFKENKLPVDPPKGNFSYVNRCGITGEILGPPNYHEYQSRLVRHHQQRLRQVPFDEFKARLQTVKDEAAVKAWVESKSFKTEYECVCCATPWTPPTPATEPAAPSDTAAPAAPVETAVAIPATVTPPTPPPTFSTRAELEKHFIEKHLAQFISDIPELRLTGTASRKIDHRGISETVRETWENERHFPLNTANGIRGRLRQEGFHSFKHKGVTYVSSIRRKHFETLAGLSDRIREIVLFLRANPECRRKKLLDHFHKPPTPATAAPAEVTPPPSAPLINIHNEDRVLADLHWLIQDGYVVEFSDGRLLAWPDLPPPPAPTPKTPPVAKEIPAPDSKAASVAEDTGTPGLPS